MSILCSKFTILVHSFGMATNFGQVDDYYSVLKKAVLRATFKVLKYLLVVMYKISIQEDVVIGRNIRLSHKGRIILGAKEIGENCMIHENVTIGMHLGGDNYHAGRPLVGNRVWIGPNTILHGKIEIGDGVTILGGTVLTKSIPSRSIVGGNPARILYREFDNTRLLNSFCNSINAQTIKNWH